MIQADIAIMGVFIIVVAITLVWFILSAIKMEKNAYLGRNLTKSRKSGKSRNNDKKPKDLIKWNSNDITEIKGIGPRRCEILKTRGIETISDLSECNPKEIANIAFTSENTASKWIEEAKEKTKIYELSSNTSLKIRDK